MERTRFVLILEDLHKRPCKLKNLFDTCNEAEVLVFFSLSPFCVGCWLLVVGCWLLFTSRIFSSSSTTTTTTTTNQTKNILVSLAKLHGHFWADGYRFWEESKRPPFFRLLLLVTLQHSKRKSALSNLWRQKTNKTTQNKTTQNKSNTNKQTKPNDQIPHTPATNNRGHVSQVSQTQPNCAPVWEFKTTNFCAWRHPHWKSFRQSNWLWFF